MLRRFQGRPAQLSFTSDFHELLEGDLQPGSSLTLRYDPDRLSPPPSYTFGDPRWPVVAFLRFFEHGPMTSLSLVGSVTHLPDRDPTGQGSMLTGVAALPAHAQFVEVWFQGGTNDIHWDSDYGSNFWFRFPYQDLSTIVATVSIADDQNARFQLSVSSIAAVHAMHVRFYDAANSVPVKQEEALRSGLLVSSTAEHAWRFECAVTPTAHIRFKLYYWIGDKRFKDDNSGQYYIAERPEAQEKIPPPPPGLISAAREWVAKA
jgi:hypothetical protein